MKRQEKLTVRELMCIIEEEIEEPRQEGWNLRHKLVDILVIVLVGIICGCEQWIEIEDFTHEKEAWLREFLELPNGIPSDDTYRRVMERIKPKQLEAAYRRWVLPYIGSCIGKHIAVDGKTVCGVNKGARENKLHIVSAWVREDGITLGQVRTREKSNEITLLPSSQSCYYVLPCPCRDTLAPPLLLLWNNKKLYCDYIISEHMFAICL